MRNYICTKLDVISISNMRMELIENIIKKQYQSLKEEQNPGDMELIKEIMREPEKYRPMYMEKMPYHVKKNHEEERKRLQDDTFGDSGSKKGKNRITICLVWGKVRFRVSRVTCFGR